MATLEHNVAPEDTQSQWVGEATIKGKSQVNCFWRLLTVDCSTCVVDGLSCWITVYLYLHRTMGRSLTVGSVEQSYGTPYLLSLGLSKAQMSLVWLAGPLSGIFLELKSKANRKDS